MPVNHRVIISSHLPSAQAVQIQIESLPQLIRCDIAPWKLTLKKTYCFMLCMELRRLFDSSGKEILVNQDGLEILLTDCNMDWPSKMQLSMAERAISGVMTKVFVLDPL